MKELVSLFEYLGQPAGPVLGKAVAEAAKISRPKMNTRMVSTANYKGPVMLYERAFLDDYFQENPLKTSVKN